MTLSGRSDGPVSSDGAVPDDLIELGRISGAYGIQGWVRVRPYASESSTLLDVADWWLRPPQAASGTSRKTTVRRAVVTGSRMQGAAIVARFADVPDRTLAEGLKGWTVWVSRANFAPLETDEYYWTDLVGCRLYGDDAGQQKLIGQVTSVADNGAHGVLHVARAVEDASGELEFQLDSKGRHVEVLVPFVAAHVHTVDLQNKRLLSDWPVD